MRRVSFPEAVGLARDGAVWITPGAWLAAALRRRFDEYQTSSSRLVWSSPRILPWRSYLQELWLQALESPGAPILLTPAQELAIWGQIIERSGFTITNRRSVARDCRAARRLICEWQMNCLPTEWSSTSDTELYAAWLDKYLSTLRKKNWTDINAASADMRAANLKFAPAFVFAGHLAYPPELEAWIQLLRRHEIPVLELDRVNHEANAAPEYRTYTDTREEWTAAAQWALEKRREGARSVAVVIADPATGRRDIEDTFHAVWEEQGEVADFVLSSAGRLADEPVVDTALNLIGLACGRLGVAEASSLLRSPFLAHAESERSARARLDAALRAASPMDVDIDRLQKLMARVPCESLSRVFDRIRRVTIPTRQPAAGWARTLTQVLNTAGWPGERSLSQAEYEAVQAWSSLLSDFVRLDLVEDSFTLERVQRVLRQLAAEARLGPAASGPVEIVTPEEADALSFDAVRVIGLHDGVWPPSPRWNALVPRSAQQRHQIPAASPELLRERAVQLTRNLRQLAAEVVFTRALSGAEGMALRPAFLLRDLKEIASPEIQSDSHPAVHLETIEDHLAPSPNASDLQRGGTRLFQLQSACPFQAYADIRLNARPLESGEPGLDPRDRGLLLHKALEQLWMRLRDHSTLMAMNPAEIAKTAAAAVESSLSLLEERRRAALDRVFRQLESERMTAVLLEWLDEERQRRPFRVESMESPLEINLGGVRIKMKLDRIDEVEGVGRVVIDYKTGVVNTRSWAGDRPKEPQVPLYAISQPDRLAGALFACLKKGEIGFKGVTAVPGLAPDTETVNDFSEQMDEWRGVLGRLAEEFGRGDAHVDPRDAEACDRCNLTALCRVRDRHGE